MGLADSIPKDNPSFPLASSFLNLMLLAKDKERKVSALGLSFHSLGHRSLLWVDGPDKE